MGDQWVEIPLPLNDNNTVSGYAGGGILENLMARKNDSSNPRPVSIISTPGLTLANSSGSGNMRGMIAHGDYLWFVRGTQLYYFNGTTATLVGTVAGTNPVQMVGAGTNQIFIVDGSTHEYVATTSAVTAVTLPGNHFCDCTYMDGYVIGTEIGTNVFWISAIDDPTTWNALDFSSADAVSDVLVGCYVHNHELYLFGKAHAEVWNDTGAASFPFQRAAVLDVSCHAPGSIAHHASTLYLVGADLRVYALDGYIPRRLSTDDAEKQLAVHGTDPTLVRASVYSERGQTFYALSPDITGLAGVNVCDIENGWWHYRSHGSGSHIGVYVDVANYAAVNYVALRAGSTLPSDVFTLSLEQPLDNGETPSRSITCPVFGEGPRVFEWELEVLMAPSAGTVELQFFDENTTTITHTVAGDISQPRLRFHRCGSFFHRMHLIYFTATQPLSIDAIRARIDVGI